MLQPPQNTNGGDGSLLREYLRRQQQTTREIQNTDLSDALLDDSSIQIHSGTVVTQSPPQDEELELFKHQVKQWITLDNEVKDISAKIRFLDKERKQRKQNMDIMKQNIIVFMGSHDIDQLNSKDHGVIKTRTSYVKEALTRKMLINRLRNSFREDEHLEEKLKDVFENRERRPKQLLLRSS